MFISFIFIFFINPSIILCIVLMIPLIADGLIQRLTPYESGNIRRLISGILFGYALVSLFIIKPGVFFFNYGYSIGQSFKA